MRNLAHFRKRCNSQKGKETLLASLEAVSWWLARELEQVMEGMCYVMDGLFGDKLGLPERWREREGPAQAASRDSARFFLSERGDQAPQNGCRTIRS
jgi:hypothetical protein